VRDLTTPLQQVEHVPKSGESSLAGKYYCELQWSALTETATLFAKGIALFLAIIAVLTGYIAGQKVSFEIARLVFYVVVVVSTVATTGSLFLTWGLHSGLKNYERSCSQLDPALFEALGISKFFARGRRVLWITATCSFIVLVSLVAVLARVVF